jgi:hypothetical protein
MSTYSLEISRKLRKEGGRLGRDGLSQRVNDLVLAFAKKHPNGHYREAIILAGRLRAISLAARSDSYWGEKTDSGFYDEAEYQLPKFQKRDEGQDS